MNGPWFFFGTSGLLSHHMALHMYIPPILLKRSGYDTDHPPELGPGLERVKSEWSGAESRKFRAKPRQTDRRGRQPAQICPNFSCRPLFSGSSPQHSLLMHAHSLRVCCAHFTKARPVLMPALHGRNNPRHYANQKMLPTYL